MTGGGRPPFQRGPIPRLGAVVLCALSIGLAARGDDSPPRVVVEVAPPILRITIRLQSMGPTASEREFERALTDTPAQRGSAERMKAALAGELSLYQARNLRGQERIDFLEQAARQGDAAAAAAIGEMLDVGDGLPADGTRAAAYYRAAAIGGRMDAAHNLGAVYARGGGVPVDFTEALAWLVAAHRRGDRSGAESRLRQFLEQRGKLAAITAAEQRAESLPAGTSPREVADALPAAAPMVFDPARAIAVGDESNSTALDPGEEPVGPPVVVTTILGLPRKWPSLAALQLAASRGDAAAMGALGRLLTNGKRLPPDPLAALVWLEQSAALGDVDAAHQLGDLYSKGDGIVADDRKAFAYFQQAARGGSALAMASVGVFHTNGRGTERDLVEGLAWLVVAKHFGVDLGQEARLRSFLRQHHPADVAKAEERSKILSQEISAQTGRVSRQP